MNDTLKANCGQPNIFAAVPLERSGIRRAENWLGRAAKLSGTTGLTDFEATALLAQLYRAVRLFVNFISTVVRADREKAARGRTGRQNLARRGLRMSE
ncbi:hypothetical protein [Bradyrhizobium sp. SBR1B]|uniref:hypothetical protein n=1 Tax=Bradyrhizobium sp. SBR1B TaxID=2663836 RepID=UPI0016059A63|nr:hypothetical protein [Bradyrhizobium sp. SBR1B]